MARPRTRWRRALGVLWCAAWVLLLATRAGAQSAADVAAARELFFEGKELATEGRWDAARDRYARSLELKHSAVSLYSLAVAQLQSGRLVEALESFRRFLREPESDATAPYRKPAAEAIEKLNERVARVTLVVRPPEPPELTVVLDGDEQIPVAALGHPRLMNPGEHDLVVTARGHRETHRRLSLDEGAEKTVEIDLAPAPIAPTPSPEPTPQESAEQALPVGSFVLMGVGSAALGVGIGVGVAAVDEAEAAPTQNGPEAEAARSKGIAADTLMAVGGAAIGVGLVWLVVELASDDAQQEEAPVARSHGGLSWSF